MPFTPYHFGPSGFFGLVLRKWIDLPVFVLANVVVDVEVLVVGLLGLGWPIHRYCHTLLVGAVVGALWGVAAYPLRNFFTRTMRVLYIPYKTGFRKMVVSGIIGVWLHVLIDGAYHSDVQIFWPYNSVWLSRIIKGRFTEEKIEAVCILFFAAAFIVYILTITVFGKNRVKAVN